MSYKTYVTFGQDHTHSIGGQTFDKDCVAVITTEKQEEGRDKAFELFGPKWCFEYPEHHWEEAQLVHFPRGYLEVKS